MSVSPETAPYISTTLATRILGGLYPVRCRGTTFGNVVAISGNILAVGEPSLNYGTVRIFTNTGSGWTQAAHMNASVANTGFGDTIALSGNTLVVGEPDYSIGVGRADITHLPGPDQNGFLTEPSWLIQKTMVISSGSRKQSREYRGCRGTVG